MATCFSILAWEIPWAENPGGLQSTGLQESDMTYPLNNNIYSFINICIYINWSFPGGSVLKNLPGQCRRHRFDPWVGKIPWRRKWQPTPVFLSGEFWTEEPAMLIGLLEKII